MSWLWKTVTIFSVSQKEQSSGNQEYVLSVTLMWKTDESGSGSSAQHQAEPFYFGCECKSIVIRFHLGESSESNRPLDWGPPIWLQPLKSTQLYHPSLSILDCCRRLQTMSEKVLKLYCSALTAHSNTLTDSTFMFENGHILSQEKTNSVEEFAFAFQKCAGYCRGKITVIWKDWGRDFAPFFPVWFMQCVWQLSWITSCTSFFAVSLISSFLLFLRAFLTLKEERF